MARFTRSEFSEAYNKPNLVCERYPEITSVKAKMLCDDIYSTDTLQKQYKNTIENIEEYLR
jgi:hypothetical protein